MYDFAGDGQPDSDGGEAQAPRNEVPRPRRPAGFDELLTVPVPDDDKARPGVNGRVEPKPWNPFGNDPRPPDWTVEDHAEYLLQRQWAERRIAKHLKLSRNELNAVIESIDRRNAEYIAMGPEKLRNRLVASIGEVGAAAWVNYETCLDETGHKNAKTLRVALDAMREVERLVGLAAPSRSMSLNIHATAGDHAQQTEALRHDPDYRAAVIEMERAERAALARLSGARDDAGPVRGAGERRVLVLQAPQRADE